MKTTVQAKVEMGEGAPCGLYCANCPSGRNGTGPDVCCSRAHCPSHLERKTCRIYQCCVVERALNDCSECADFPCAMLLRFSHDEHHPERLPAVLNLQRRLTLGATRWLVEEQMFWGQVEKSGEWGAFQQALKEKRRYLNDMHVRVRAVSAEVELAGLYVPRKVTAESVRTHIKA